MDTQLSWTRHSSDAQEQRPLNEGSSESIGEDKNQATHDRLLVRVRSVRSWRVWLECIPDMLLALASTYFIIFAFLVYSHRGQHVDFTFNKDLLQAAKYVSFYAHSKVEEDCAKWSEGPTLFPILFAAVVAKLLKSTAALRLEHGTSVLSVEYLLSSRTVFSALITPLILRPFHSLAPALIVLWALSPLGGQASLRVITTELSATLGHVNISYLGYASPLSNGGVGSASAGTLGPINAAFTSLLASSPEAKLSSQDLFGNIKVPMLESLMESNVTRNVTDWITVPKASEDTWSALSGLPSLNVPNVGSSNFTFNTAYMMATCSLNALSTNCTWQQCMSGSGNASFQNSPKYPSSWSGANYNLTSYGNSKIAAYPWVNIEFYSVANELPMWMGSCSGEGCKLPEQPKNKLTKAECMINMSYVEAQIHCEGRSCAATAVRPSLEPKVHVGRGMNSSSWLNNTVLTGIGVGRNGAYNVATDSFWQSLVVATNPSIACDTTTCPTSAIENYLADPLSVGATPGAGNPLLWQVGNEAFSRRMTQLINTYWINSIAPYAISGNFTLNSSNSIYDSYNIDSDLATHFEPFTAIECNYVWLAMLLIASRILFIAAVTSVILSLSRRGPDILDSFSSILRYNKDLPLPSHSSMENSSDIARLLGNTRWRCLP